MNEFLLALLQWNLKTKSRMLKWKVAVNRKQYKSTGVGLQDRKRMVNEIETRYNKGSHQTESRKWQKDKVSEL